MAEPVREIANTSVSTQSFPFHNFSNQSSALPDSSLPAGGQAEVHTNADQARPPSRTMSTASSGSQSSLEYTERLKATSSSTLWAEQMDMDELNPLPLANDTLSPQKNYLANTQTSANTLCPDMHADNIHNPADLFSPEVIPYDPSAPADPSLWDGQFNPISLFGTDKLLIGDAKNVSCSLHRIAVFIKQHSIKDKDPKDFPQLHSIGAAAWELLLAIYEAGWDKLPSQTNGMTFRQNVMRALSRKKSPVHLNT